MLSTPAGRPASVSASASAYTVSGVSGAGLSTTEQPAASAGAVFSAGVLSGPFHGVIAATTPTGSWTTRLVLTPSLRGSV
jgi:hypothetical protein